MPSRTTTSQTLNTAKALVSKNDDLVVRPTEQMHTYTNVNVSDQATLAMGDVGMVSGGGQHSYCNVNVEGKARAVAGNINAESLIILLNR
jgi:hypothetical protein